MGTRNCRWSLLAAVALALVVAPVSMGAKRPAKSPRDRSAAAAPAETVDLLDAIASKQIQVKFAPHSSAEARLTITNKTSRPLSVRLPDGLVGRPVLAQFRAGVNPLNPGGLLGPNPGGGRNPLGGGAAPQAVGVGAASAMNPGARGNGQNMWNIPAEKRVQRNVACVCLEHGRPDPRPSVPYELVAVKSYSDKPELATLLGEFSTGRYDQRTIQAAAWNVSSGLSWDELTAKRLEHVDGTTEPFFDPSEVRAARDLVKQLAKPAPEPVASSSSGE